MNWANRNGVHVDKEHIYIDEGVSGKTQDRPGLNALLAALAANEIDVVVVFMTSRLFRKMYKALEFVDVKIVAKRKRCVFVRQGIDTNDAELWKPLLQVWAMLDERQIAMLKSYVNAAHEGLLLKNWVHSTITFGYQGKPVDGPPTKTGKPRKEWAIDPVAAECVVKIYRWFLGMEPGVRALGDKAIARKLNRLHAPLPPKVRGGRWTAQAVRLVLQNRRYIGDWGYGWTESVWQDEAGYNRQFERDEPLVPHKNQSLRILDDVIFFAAQEKRANLRAQAGNRKRNEDGDGLPHLFEQLFWCPTHNRFLWSYGKCRYMCPTCKGTDSPTLYSILNGKVAAKVICQKIAELLLADHALCSQIVAAFATKATDLMTPKNDDKAAILKEKERITRQIQFIYESPASTDTDRREQHQVLSTLQLQRAALDKKLSTMNCVEQPVRIPTEKEIWQRLQRLSNVLMRAATSNDLRVISAAHRILELVTGGRMVLTQQGEAVAKRGWLRAAFSVDVLKVTSCGELAPTATSTPILVEVDLKEPECDMVLASKAKALFDEGLLIEDIAQRLGINRNYAHELIHAVFEEKGEQMPDGRSRRATLENKHLEQPVYQKIAEQAKIFWDGGLPLEDIAENLNVCPDTVTAALKHWFESRGLPYPDGRLRRKELRLMREGKLGDE